MKTELHNMSADEWVIFGGLIRVLLTADGTFSPVEEAWLDALSIELDLQTGGARGLLWQAVSNAAQRYPNPNTVLDHIARVRPPMRPTILAVLSSLAAADRVAPSELDLIGTVRKSWSL